jgi:nucleoside-diphosphate-sugar epimerase
MDLTQMEHVFFGFGYCAQYLAKHLQTGIAISRNPHLDIAHIQADVAVPGLQLPDSYVMYYFIPPKPGHDEDILLKNCLVHLPKPPQKIIYIGSSGIYGHHQGQWVNENSPCYIRSHRQALRQSSEHILTAYAKEHHLPCALLRVAGIYGPDRLPETNAPIISPEQAPLMNHIFIEDLAIILKILGTSVTFDGVLNIADGDPKPMGYLQQQVAIKYQRPLPEQIDFQTAWDLASDMKKEFMSQNKQLSIEVLLQLLKPQQIQLKNIASALLSF